MINPTGENIRYCAAAHMSCAAELIEKDYLDAAKVVLAMVSQWLDAPAVSAPPQVREKVDICIKYPGVSLTEIYLLESWFVDPLNTIIESTGAVFRA